MRIHVVALALLFSVLVAPAQSSGPTHVWSRQFGGGGTYINPNPRIVTDASGNIYLQGYFDGPVDFGGGPRTGPAFILSLDSNGAYRWDLEFPATGTVGFDWDPTGGVVIGSSFTGTIDLGGVTLTSAGAEDCFVAKVTTSGQFGWRKRFGGTGEQTCRAVACDANGNVVMTGGWAFANPYWREFFATKLDADGNELWTRRVFEEDHQAGTAAAFDANGDVVFGAQYLGTPDFGGGPLADSGPQVNIALVKYSADGTHLWSRGFGDGATQLLRCIDFDSSNNLWITGSFQGSIGFGGDVFHCLNNDDMFVASLDPNGVHRSSRQVGAGVDLFYDFQYSNAIAVDAHGDALVTGAFELQIDLGGGMFYSTNWDAFVAKYTPAAEHVWSHEYGINGATWASAIGVDDVGNIIVAGHFDGSVDFGGGPMTHGSGTDMFVAKFTDAPVPVLFSRFEATASGSVVEIDWEYSSDEAVQDFTLYRREGDDARAIVIATGDANATRSYTDATVEPGQTYHFELVIHTVGGMDFRSPVATTTVRTIQTSLGPNYPNPFNPKTTIEYAVAESGPVAIEIFDVTGALVTRLEQGARTPGTYRAEWDGRDATGRSMGSGVYFYRLSGTPEIAARKMILLK